MVMPVAERRYTVADYLRFEREAEERHEYRDGEIVLMTGRTFAHSLITANVIGALGNALRNGPSRVYESNLRIRVPRTLLYTYSDVSVICGPVQLDPQDSSGETVTNPRLIVEVLSPSTEGYDRGDKFSRYRQLESLEEHVLVSQETARVESFFRQPEGTWLLTPVSGIESRIRLRSLQIDLAFAEIYAGVEFPAPQAPPEPQAEPR